jgi:hypothetical protein
MSSRFDILYIHNKIKRSTGGCHLKVQKGFVGFYDCLLTIIRNVTLCQIVFLKLIGADLHSCLQRVPVDIFFFFLIIYVSCY